MPSSAEARTTAVCFWVAAVAALWLAAFASGATATAANADSPSEDEVARALRTLESDPNLATEEKRRIPKFFDDRPEPAPAPRISSTLRNLLYWIAQTGRFLVWVLGAILAVVLLTMLVRQLRKPGRWRGGSAPTVTPTHVRELDVRPESLPVEIGPAALSLWEQNQPRAALALLYRGLVSRLIHVHAVPIRDSTTEAGCLELARGRISASLAVYAAQLVRCWQRSMYGQMLPDDASFRALCGSFDAALGAPATASERAA